MCEHPYILNFIYAVSMFGLTLTLYLIGRHMNRVCKEMRAAQREFLCLSSKYTGSTFPGNLADGTSISADTDRRVSP